MFSTYNIQMTQFNFTYQHLNFIVDTSDTGRGIYRQTGITGNNLSSGFKISIYPNPFREVLNISYSLSKASDVNIEVTDVLGHSIETIISGKQENGPL